MKNFIIKSLLFVIPISLFFVPPLVIFVMSGEYMPMSQVVNIQEKNPDVLYLSSATSFTDKPYKLAGTISHKSDVIVVGTSRTLTFDSDFFKAGTFYNAGYTADYTLNADDLSQYINALPSGSDPKIILFDASSYLTSTNLASENSFTYNPFTYFITTGWRDFYVDYFSGYFSLEKFLAGRKSDDNIGLNAVISGHGYRADGSLDRGTPAEIQEVQKTIPSEIAETVSDIQGSTEYETSILEANLARVEEFLSLCKSRNIYVIGYLSPYALEVYEKLESLNDIHGATYREVPNVLNSLFSKYGYGFYDLRDISLIGSSDSELYDGSHPTEKSTIRLLIYLAEREPKLSAYVDIPTLEQKIISQPF